MKPVAASFLKSLFGPKAASVRIVKMRIHTSSMVIHAVPVFMNVRGVNGSLQ
jgi:hypothetical protein